MHGLPGKNISCDLYMEHLNRLLKDAIKALGDNKTPLTVWESASLLWETYSITLILSINLHLKEQITKFQVLTRTYMTHIVNELCGAGVFNDVPGRKHASFKTFKNNPILTLNKKDVNGWMKVQWTKLLAGLL